MRFESHDGYFMFFNTIEWNRKFSCKTGIYLARWRLDLGLFAINLHHWFSSDDTRAMHNHPYWMVILPLGRYIDRTENGDEIVKPFHIYFRKKEHTHSVIIDRPIWTILITGPKLYKWGFFIDGKFLRSEKYFKKYGDHYCK